MLHEKIILSIIIITYNQEETIKKTIESILSQNISVPYEILIGDDCSSDKTREILEKYQNAYPDNIKLILNPENMGVVKNYFNLLKMCKGEFVMECAGDDYWLENKVKKQLEIMNANSNIGLIYGKALKYFDDINKMSKQTKGERCESFMELLSGNKIPALTVCFRNDIAQCFIDKVNPQIKNWKMEDYPLWLWFAKNSKIQYEDDLYAVYRITKESISHSENLDKKKSFIENMESIATFFAGDNTAYLQVIQNNKNRELAWLYLQANDRKMYRKYIKRTNIFSDKFRYLLSISNQGFKYLRSRMLK